MPSTMLESRRLTKQFGTFVAVDDVSFAAGRGEVVGLLGANGAGKTTTIRMLIGLLAPTSGSALFLGGPPNREARRDLGYVAQGLGLYKELTIKQNVDFSAAAFGSPSTQLPEDLASMENRKIGDVPLGVQRQVAFACALQHQPRLLVLDEPTSGVEPLAAARLWDRIRHEADEGACVLVSTHSMQEARQCDRLLLMSSSRLVAAGSERDIVGDTTAVLVSTDKWADAFTQLSNAGVLVTLDGRDVRAINVTEQVVADALLGAGVSASTRTVAATLDEKMAALSVA
jgi:ABC-2 type transport system ATP-binding protein/ribosome-dependent ATPase